MGSDKRLHALRSLPQQASLQRESLLQLCSQQALLDHTRHLEEFCEQWVWNLDE